MRVISQNGMDFPYEQMVAFADEGNIRCYLCNDSSGRFWTLGVYSSEEKADKVLKMMHGQYLLPQMEDREHLYLGNIFQFPEDDEVEV